MRRLLYLLALYSVMHADAISDIVGPVTAMDTSPWPWYDYASEGTMIDIADAAIAAAPVPTSTLSGTFTLAAACGSPAGSTLTGAGASAVSIGDKLIVQWDGPDGAGTGRMLFVVTDKVSTTLYASAHCGLPTGMSGASGLTVYTCTTGCYDVTSSYSPAWYALFVGSGVDGWNYYDTALGIYRLWLRTGDAAHLTRFRQLADIWWVWALNQGAIQITDTRGLSLAGMFVRALDIGGSQGTARLNAIHDLLDTYNTFSPYRYYTGNENREQGYLLMFNALGAIADSTNRTDYCSVLATRVPQWITWQEPAGYWKDKVGQYPYLADSVSPWRMFPIVQGLERSYDALTNPAICNDAASAAGLLDSIEFAVTWTYTNGFSQANRGMYYDVVGAASGLEGRDNYGLQTGTVSVNLTSAAVTGVGTSFTTVFNCDGTDYIGIVDPSTGFAWTYVVTSCADNTHLTLGANFNTQYFEGVPGQTGPTGNASGWSFYYVPETPTNCGSSAAHCWTSYMGSSTGGLLDGSVNLTREVIWQTGWAYKTTLNPIYKTYGDDMFAATYGGPANGPGYNYPGSEGACGGPNCVIQSTQDFTYSLHACAVTPGVPCNPTRNDSPSNVLGGGSTGKRYAQGDGIGGAANYLYWRTLDFGTPARTFGNSRTFGGARTF